jgi:ribosome maturation factor RimP
VEYIAHDKIPYFNDCEPLVAGFGCKLVELVAFKRQSSWQVKIVITSDAGAGIVECTRVHRAILPRLEALLDSQDMYVEVTTPGIDRILKNASEFDAFKGKQVKVWNTELSDWISGAVVSAGADSVLLSTAEGEREIPYSKIAKAKLNNA